MMDRKTALEQLAALATEADDNPDVFDGAYRGGVIYGVPNPGLARPDIHEAARNLGARIGSPSWLAGVGVSADGSAIEVRVWAQAAHWLEDRSYVSEFDGFPVIARPWWVPPRPFGDLGYATPTRYAVLSPSRIRNEEE